MKVFLFVAVLVTIAAAGDEKTPVCEKTKKFMHMWLEKPANGGNKDKIKELAEKCFEKDHVWKGPGCCKMNNLIGPASKQECAAQCLSDIRCVRVTWFKNKEGDGKMVCRIHTGNLDAIKVNPETDDSKKVLKEKFYTKASIDAAKSNVKARGMVDIDITETYAASFWCLIEDEEKSKLTQNGKREVKTRY